MGIWLGLSGAMADVTGELAWQEGSRFALSGPLTAVDECSVTVDWDSSQHRRQ